MQWVLVVQARDFRHCIRILGFALYKYCSMARRRDKKAEREIVLERMQILFDKAKESARSGELGQANRYVGLARALGMKYNVRVPRELKRLYCKHCYKFLLPGKTSRSRVNSQKKRVEVRCLSCERLIYYPLSKSKAGK